MISAVGSGPCRFETSDSGELLDSALSWIGARKTRVDICKQDKMKDVLYYENSGKNEI